MYTAIRERDNKKCGTWMQTRKWVKAKTVFEKEQRNAIKIPHDFELHVSI